MKLLTSFLVSCVFVSSLSLSACAQESANAGDTARSSIIDNSGQEIGEATYSQGPDGVVMEIKVSGLPSGKHGMHFHEVGTCEDHDHFKMAKGHVMPTGKPHGYLNFDGGPHEGNLPNLIVGADGSAHVELYSSLVSLEGQGDKPALLDDDGSTLMIHANPDDHVTQPIGGSGARIACGVIERSR